MSELEEFLARDAVDPVRPLFSPGEFIGSWRVLAFLGGGGFGEIYRVEQEQVGLVCALKLLKRDTSAARIRFQREARLLAEQLHPAMPRFYEFGEHAGHPFLVMELLVPRDMPTRGRHVATLLRQLCSVLSVLHAHGLVHRDIKPSNVLFRGTGEAVLIDYGLVKETLPTRETRDYPALTQEGVALGTQGYAAPEQFAGDAVDISADIHALGVLADSCFDGNAPWWWRRIIRRATSSLPRQRYKTAVRLSWAVTLRLLPEALALLVLAALVVVFAAVFAGFPHREVSTVRDDSVEVMPSPRGVRSSGNASTSAADWL